ncbi:MAG: hypothetical protein ACTSVV_00160 [Promethearchaeota archaeon]
MALEYLEILSGLFSLFAVSLAFFIGFKIISRYFEFKKREFLLVGITSITITEPWWGSVISFIIAVTMNNNGLYNYPTIYFLINNLLIPIGILFWLIAISDLMFKKYKKQLIIFGIIYGCTFEITFLTLLFTDPSLIGTLITPVDVEYHFIMAWFLLSTILFILITGLFFARESLKSDKKEIQLRGKLMFVGFLLFTIGAILDSVLPLEASSLIIARSILMSSSIFLYGGFILPNWMKRIFLKENN